MSVRTRRAMRLAVMACVGLAFTVVIPACGKRDKVGRTVPVVGKVTFQGRTLAEGTVIFRPDAEKGNGVTFEPRGPIDAEGRYKLATAGKEGAPPGWYRVGVVSYRIVPGETTPKAGAMPPAPEPIVPIRYNDPAKSGLSLQVKEGAADDAYDLNLEVESGGKGAPARP